MNSLIKILFRNGLIGGVLGCIALATFYYIGRHPFLFAPYFDFRIVIFSVFIFMGLKEVRDYYLQGYLSFFQGMIGSFVFIITSALMGSIFTLAIASWDSKFISTYIEKMNEEMVLLKKEFIESMGEKVYQLQLQKLQSTSAFDLAGDYFLKSLIIGLFLAIVISIILRKQPKTN